MISSLKGVVSRIGNNWLEVETGGLGYEVFVGINLLKKQVIGENIKLFTYQSVSENDISLFGFETSDEVEMFKMLILVSGVGPKTGSQIMGQTSSEEIIKAIGEADVDFFQKIKGIGKKTAQKIIIDLKSKIGGLGELDLTQGDKTTEADEVFLSLKQLGFERKEIEKVIIKLPKELKTTEEKLGWCLANIG